MSCSFLYRLQFSDEPCTLVNNKLRAATEYRLKSQSNDHGVSTLRRMPGEKPATIASVPSGGSLALSTKYNLSSFTACTYGTKQYSDSKYDECKHTSFAMVVLCMKSVCVAQKCMYVYITRTPMDEFLVTVVFSNGAELELKVKKYNLRCILTTDLYDTVEDVLETTGQLTAISINTPVPRYASECIDLTTFGSKFRFAPGKIVRLRNSIVGGYIEVLCDVDPAQRLTVGAVLIGLEKGGITGVEIRYKHVILGRLIFIPNEDLGKNDLELHQSSGGFEPAAAAAAAPVPAPVPVPVPVPVPAEPISRVVIVRLRNPEGVVMSTSLLANVNKIPLDHIFKAFGVSAADFNVYNEADEHIQGPDVSVPPSTTEISLQLKVPLILPVWSVETDGSINRNKILKWQFANFGQVMSTIPQLDLYCVNETANPAIVPYGNYAFVPKIGNLFAAAPKLPPPNETGPDVVTVRVLLEDNPGENFVFVVHRKPYVEAAELLAQARKAFSAYRDHVLTVYTSGRLVNDPGQKFGTDLKLKDESEVTFAYVKTKPVFLRRPGAFASSVQYNVPTDTRLLDMTTEFHCADCHICTKVQPTDVPVPGAIYIAVPKEHVIEILGGRRAPRLSRA